MDELEVRTVDGVTLRLDRVRATGPRSGVVVCLHAMMTDGRYFGARRADSFAAALGAAGCDVIVPDFRGHGRSVPPRAGPDDWSFDDLVERDLPAIVAAASAASSCPAGDLVVLGHSLGGLVTIAALGTRAIPPPRLVVIASTTVWLLGPQGPLARRAMMAAYRGMTMMFGRAPVRALRAGTADESAAYVDQLTGWARTARWTSLRGIDYGHAARTIAVPIVPIVGAGDRVCTAADAARFARWLPTASPLRVVGRAHGDALDPDHFQLFTSPELAPVRTELIDRLTSRDRD